MDYQSEAEYFRENENLKSVKERSELDTISAINRAKERVGIRQGLGELAADTSRYSIASSRLNLKSIEPPIPASAEKFIAESIEKQWRLTKIFRYCIKYLGQTCDDLCMFYYYEVIFSQPTAAYPIPQATASVFFRVEQDLADKIKAPMVWFRLEGGHTDYDVRNVAPAADWILALIQMKVKFFKRIESMKCFQNMK